jgi:hypothetical protein
MGDAIISGGATLWFAPIDTEIPDENESFEDAGWQSADEWFHDIAMQFYECEDAAPKREFVFEPISITVKFTPSPEFWGIIVGMQLQYGLRELHRNLARYASWPYTN